MTAGSFQVLALNPAGLGGSGLALAATRAGAVGLLDLTACPNGRLAQAKRELEALAGHAPAGAQGLRLEASQSEALTEFLPLVEHHSPWLVIAGPDAAALDRAAAALPSLDGLTLLAEVTSLAMAEALEPGRWAGLVAAGWEAGGRAGGESGFVLLQRLLAAGLGPVYLRGGLGPHTARACRAMGAAGAVLDDHLLLMPESPLPAAWRARLGGLTASDALALGEGMGRICRVAARPDLPGGLALRDSAAELECAGERDAWEAQAAQRAAWDDPEQAAWPVGQAVGLARPLTDKHRTTGRLVRAITEPNPRARQAAVAALAAGSPLAQALGTRLPLVQGPMARVSDTPAFALAVAEAGALPCLALGMLDPERAAGLMADTAALFDGQPWGVGLLGFLPVEHWQGQLARVIEAKPKAAIIAGGRPRHAQALEEAGVAAFLHAPTPELLALFLERGVNRFVLEGWECGGHVGPLGSLALWEAACQVLAALPAARAAKVQVLLAGGIWDARSAAGAVRALGAAAERGVAVGLQMGTAYLLSQEAAHTGAVTEQYQRLALEGGPTLTLASAPGHANRALDTAFARTFRQTRCDLLAQGAPAGRLGEELDTLTRGRLLMAAKGRDRERELSPEEQLAQGMYSVGQDAVLCGRVRAIAELHAEVTQQAAALLAPAPAPRRARPARPPAEIAVIGLAAFLPGAGDLAAYWQNVLTKTGAIGEIPPERWDWRLFYRPGQGDPDMVCSKWGGFMDPVPFDPLVFGIPPKALRHISSAQLLALEGARRALADAGYDRGGFDRESTAVIFAAAQAGGMLDVMYNARAMLRLVMGGSLAGPYSRLADFSEESFPGILDNVVSGRVANRLDLGGPNFTVDGACASSLHAVDAAVKELESGRSSLVIVGGVEVGQNPVSYAYFSNTQALSPTGRVSAFDRSADGTVTSEGAVVAVLKRLPEAVADGDRVYAVIRAVGSSSDGRALGLTAPRPEGHKLALKRAYGRAGFPPSALGLLEAHATGTSVGDEAELKTITETLAEAGAGPGACVVGSAKQLIGHTKVAAGLAGLAKAALALHHRVLPPQGGISEPLAGLAAPDTPVKVLERPQPWLAQEAPRRAAVSALGFGGTNAHVVLEEHRDPARQRPLGGGQWPAELFLITADDPAALGKQVRGLADALKATTRDGALPPLSDIAYGLALKAAARRRPACLAVAAEGPDQLAGGLQAALARLDDPESAQPLPPGVSLGLAADRAPGKLALLFPGQGAQHVGMGAETALYFAEPRRVMAEADRVLARIPAEPLPRPLSGHIWPSAAFDEDMRRRQEAELTDSRVTQPAVGAISAGLYLLMRRLGLSPDMAAGHSYGEYTALYAAGALDLAEFLRLSELRGRHMARACDSHGAMAALKASRPEVERLLEDFEGVVLANHNAPMQTVVSGEKRQVRRLVEHLEADGVAARLLPVAGAFHSSLMEPAREPFGRVIREARLAAPQMPVYSNVTAAPHAEDPEAVKEVLDRHLLSPVEFVDQVERMHADGARVFLELGPRSVLTGLTGRILEGREHLALSAAGLGGGLKGLLAALGALAAAGVAWDPPALFAGREVEPVDLARLGKGEAKRQMWWVDGETAWPQGQTRPSLGRLPLLDADSRAAEPAPAVGAAAGDQEMLAAYRAYQETMQQFLETQERVMTRLLGGESLEGLELPPLPGLPSATAAPPRPAAEIPAAPNQPAPAAGSAAETAALDQAGLVELLQRIIGDKTGYPVDMLGPELDLEAELGIDSIKRVEVVGELRRELPAAAAALDAAGEALTRAKTLTAMAGLLLAELKDNPPPLAAAPPEDAAEPAPPTPTQPAACHAPQTPSPPAAPVEAAPTDAEAEPCSRHVMQAVAEPLPAIDLTKPEGLYLVTADSGGVAEALAKELEKRGAVGGVIAADDLASPEAARARLVGLTAQHGPVRGIVHLAPLDGGGDPEDLAQWRQAVQRLTKGLYLLLHLAADDLNRPEYARMGRVLAVGGLGGFFGRDGRPSHLPAGGGCMGLVKAVDQEWPRVLAKAVDLPARPDPERAASVLAREMLLPGGELEVGYPEWRRRVFMPVAAEIAATQPVLRPESDWVVLAVGGARGITALAAAELVRPGTRLILAGSSPPPGAEPAELAGLADAAALRAHFIARAAAEGGRPTPATVEVQVSRVLANRQMRANLEHFASLGARPEYHQADFTDEAAVIALLADLYGRFGRLDAVIFGAGIIADKLLADKDPASFDRVFDVKADGAFLLARHLKPESLKLLALFSSTAGRFGNRGQADYAAANELLNRLAWWLTARWPDSRVVAINWGPWEGLGMADDAVRRQLARRGFRPITPEAGAAFFRREATLGPRDQAEVVAGGGPWDYGWEWRTNPHGDFAAWLEGA